MGKIVAIGGGEIGRPGHKIETLKIDKELIKLSNKKHPVLLFIPTASFDSEGYIKVVRKYFGKRLGCKVATLKLSKKPSIDNIRKKVLNSDIIYVGGGNTKHMMQQWRKFGLDKVLLEAYKKDIVLSGVSAGAICWFQYGNSDSLKLAGLTKNGYTRIKGLGLIKGTGSPHHIREKDRTRALKKTIIKYGGVGVALDDFSALVITNNTFKIITSRSGSKISKVFKKNGKIVTKTLSQNDVQLQL